MNYIPYVKNRMSRFSLTSCRLCERLASETHLEACPYGCDMPQPRNSDVVSRLGLEPRTLALKARKDQNINGLILRRFPRFFFTNKDLR
jgi:hypothetical protein